MKDDNVLFLDRSFKTLELNVILLKDGFAVGKLGFELFNGLALFDGGLGVRLDNLLVVINLGDV